MPHSGAPEHGCEWRRPVRCPLPSPLPLENSVSARRQLPHCTVPLFPPTSRIFKNTKGYVEVMKKITTYKMAAAGLMAALTCILGPMSIAIPISPVPISLTNLVIYLSVYILGWKLGTISYLVYLLLGLAGLPVLSGFTGGAGKLFGPTGGYLIGFILMAVCSGWFVQKFHYLVTDFAGMVLGTCIAYLLGTVWLAYQAGMNFGTALMAGVIPFIPGDLVKILIILLIGPVIRRRLTKAGFHFYSVQSLPEK